MAKFIEKIKSAPKKDKIKFAVLLGFILVTLIVAAILFPYILSLGISTKIEIDKATRVSYNCFSDTDVAERSGYNGKKRKRNKKVYFRKGFVLICKKGI